MEGPYNHSEPETDLSGSEVGPVAARQTLTGIDAAREFCRLIAGDGAELTFEAYFPKGHARNDAGRITGTFEERLCTLQDWSLEGRSIYVRVNEGGPKKTEITAVRGLSIEFDAPEAHHRASQTVPDHWHLEPNALVVRGESVHAHWLIDNCPVAQFDDCQRRAQQSYSSDPNALGVQRIWRVPGFPHPLYPDQNV